MEYDYMNQTRNDQLSRVYMQLPNSESPPKSRGINELSRRYRSIIIIIDSTWTWQTKTSIITVATNATFQDCGLNNALRWSRNRYTSVPGSKLMWRFFQWLLVLRTNRDQGHRWHDNVKGNIRDYFPFLLADDWWPHLCARRESHTKIKIYTVRRTEIRSLMTQTKHSQMTLHLLKEWTPRDGSSPSGAPRSALQ
jgi:hypothetical protein